MSSTSHPGNPPGSTRPLLRLVGGSPLERTDPADTRPPVRPAPRAVSTAGPAAEKRSGGDLAAGDPRWVLALRVADSLEGTTLPPARRQALLRMGRVFGLTAFDANLIIAIVQDQARRGHRPEICPRMGQAQLAMIPGPTDRASTRRADRGRWITIALLVVAMAAIELAVIGWWFR